MGWPGELWLSRAHSALRRSMVKGPVSAGLFEFLMFGIKQGWACIFAGSFLFILLATHFFYPPDWPLARYDFLVLAALALQALLLLTKLESFEEARVILIFHIVGTVMELFKTAMGSWTYPEESLLRIGEVPLFSGFMYAAVGSYLARVWRLFDFEFSHFPPLWAQGLLAFAVYVNFFSHHFLPDMRAALFAAILLLYGRCRVCFRPDYEMRSMPLVAGFFLVALFIWFAENIATFARAWSYPDQAAGWVMVSPSKLGAWYLLMLISFVLVAAVHGQRAGAHRSAPARQSMG